MKKTLFLLFVLFFANLFPITAQTESSAYESTTQNFVNHYNKGDYEAVFSMFADVMKKALPLEKTVEFFKALKMQAGNIKQYEFIKYIQTAASYKTVFERTVLTMNLSLDNNSKINGLYFKPYTEHNSVNKDVQNNLTLNSITKKQADLIFRYSKDFPKKTELAIALIANKKTNFYGTKKLENKIITAENKNDVFEIGSVTKVFTATLLAELISERKLKQGDFINDYYYVFPFKNNTKIKFADLANHTSGLPRLPSNLNLSQNDVKNPYKNYSENDLLEYLKNDLEITNKGNYQYSNLGMGLLGYTLGKTVKLNYDELLKRKILSPYSMQNTTVNISMVKSKIIPGLDASGNEVPNWEFSVLVGAGGIYSTAEDLSKFIKAQFDSANKALALTRKTTVRITDNMSIGLGWHIITRENGDKLYWHNGGTNGYSSSVVFDVKNKIGVIILSNVSAFNPDAGNIEKLSFELMKTLREK